MDKNITSIRSCTPYYLSPQIEITTKKSKKIRRSEYMALNTYIFCYSIVQLIRKTNKYQNTILLFLTIVKLCCLFCNICIAFLYVQNVTHIFCLISIFQYHNTICFVFSCLFDFLFDCVILCRTCFLEEMYLNRHCIIYVQSLRRNIVIK